jgi:rod shape-determining protein MreD
MKRLVVAVLALVAALLVQLTIVNGLPLPGGGAPDLVLLCVVAIGMTSGPRAGVIAGFCAGLALDLAPPAVQLVGQYALVLTLAGYCAGRLRILLMRSAVLAIAAAAAVAVLGEALAAGLTLVLDTPQVTLSTVAHVLPWSVLYDVVAGPLVLLVWVKAAVLLGAKFDLHEGSPALEPGGSAAPSALAGIGVATAAPVGAVGWLAGPGRSRRARREQARLTAAIAGATPGRAAFWVGRRPPGLVPVSPSALTGRSGLERLRPSTGAPGTAASAGTAFGSAAFSRPGAGTLPGRPLHLGLAREQRRNARSNGHRAPQTGRYGPGESHGVDSHGVNGPGLPRIGFGSGRPLGAGQAAGRAIPKIAFGSGGLPGSGRRAGRGTPRIAFGTGGLLGSGRAAGRGTPRIAFGTGGLLGSGRAAGPGTPRIAFGTGGLTSSGRVAGRAAGRGTPRIAFGSGGLTSSGRVAGRAAGRGTPRIAFGTGGLAGSGRAARRGTPRIAFGTGGLAGSGRPAGRGTPRIAFGTGGAVSAFRASPGRLRVPRFPAGSSRSASGAWLARSAGPGGLALSAGGTAGLGGALRGPGIRRVRQPRFARSTAGHSARQPKTAKFGTPRRPLRWLPGRRRAGDRSTVWRIGGARMGGLR